MVLETRFTGETFEPGEVITINWAILVDHDQIDWGLYFSKDGGDSWEPIEEGLPLYQLTYDWDAPHIESAKMLIQIVQNNDLTEDYYDRSDTFAIHSEDVTPVLDFKSADLNVTISPNPVTSQAAISIQSPLNELLISIFNSHGQIVEELDKSKRISSLYSYQWDTENLSAGLYFLKIEGEGKAKVVPMVVSH